MHIGVSVQKRIPCHYKTSGCNAVILREDRLKHLQENIEQHGNIANDTVSMLRKELACASNALESKRVPPVTHKINSYAQLKETKGEWESTCFYTHEGGYKMILRVYAGYRGEDCLATYVRIVLGPNDDKLVWPFAGSIKIEILNQSHDYGHYSGTLHWKDTPDHFPSAKQPTKGSRNCGWGFSKFISYADLERESSSRVYIKNNCVYFRISEALAATQCRPWLICSP